jgi:undecaprenyl-diphosphatase
VADKPADSQKHVKQVLEEELKRIDSPEVAEMVLKRIEAIPAGATEEKVANDVVDTPADETLDRAAGTPGRSRQVAAVLTTAAAQAVTEKPEADKVVSGAQEALGTRGGPIDPAAEQGKAFLKEAALKDLPPFQAIDARLFLAINNGLPHNRVFDGIADAIALITNGGWIWGIGTYVAYRLGLHRNQQALRMLLPSVAAATWLVEHPIKTYFRRQRPFVDVVRAMVIGKKPGSWSFPSGHTAASFAAAWILSTVWPRRAPAYFSIASLIGISRVYVGVHYPGDVLSGAAMGMALGEIMRRLCRAVLG